MLTVLLAYNKCPYHKILIIKHRQMDKRHQTEGQAKEVECLQGKAMCSVRRRKLEPSLARMAAGTMTG